MNAPRPSLLNLFDPLRSPSTPRRNTPPTPLGSNKENEDSAQDKLTLTAFFNRTYTRNRVQPSTSSCLYKGRLVDVGDVTMTDQGVADSERGGEDQSEESQGACIAVHGENKDETSRNNLLFKLDDQAPLSATVRQRPALVDIMPEVASVRDDSSQDSYQASHSSPSQSAFAPEDTITSSAHMTCSSPVIDDTKDDTKSLVLATSTQDGRGTSSSASHLTVEISCQSVGTDATTLASSPAASHSSSPNASFVSSTAFLVPSSTAALLVNTSLSSLSPSGSSMMMPSASSSSMVNGHLAPPGTGRQARPQATLTSSSSSRNSLDLHTSFNLHLRADSSFDLLNDKISFLGETSLLNGLEDDFDLEAEERAMEALIAKEERSKSTRFEEIKEESETVIRAAQATITSDVMERASTPDPIQTNVISEIHTPENKCRSSSHSQEPTPQACGQLSAKCHKPEYTPPPIAKDSGACGSNAGTPVARPRPRRLSRHAGAVAQPLLSEQASVPVANILPPITALRVVKRSGTGKGHYKTVSADNGNASASAQPTQKTAPVAAISRRSSVAPPCMPSTSSRAPTATQPAPVRKMVVKGVQRPAPGSGFVLPKSHRQLQVSAAATVGSGAKANSRNGDSATQYNSSGRAVTGAIRITGVQRPPVPLRAQKADANGAQTGQTGLARPPNSGPVTAEMNTRNPSSKSALNIPIPAEPKGGRSLRAPSQTRYGAASATTIGGVSAIQTKLPMARNASSSKVPGLSIKGKGGSHIPR